MEENGKIGMILLTGYLGAGKTTMLNNLLQKPVIREKKIALIINEFGSLGVDGALVKSDGATKYELNKGSLFCICIKTDFIKTLKEISEEVKPELVLVEATGVAETRDLLEFIDAPGLKENFKVLANVCIVDALDLTKVLGMMKAAREQVKRADGIVINKVDLVEREDVDKLRDVIRSLNPDAPIIDTTYGMIPSDFIFDLEHEQISGEEIKEPPAAVFAAAFRTEKPVDRERFMSVLDDFKENILRLKGCVDFGAGPGYFEVINGRISEKETCPSGKNETAFSVIAWNIRENDLKEAFSFI